ncbi:helix-turn-helix transcriptional regulator [Aquabacterium sp. A7-Y]|uniref:helix-turn-helix transcriptional regulator n=1 Tax=Aquabacterium sp. A7-Y TaxID=1349605 RepID=UPI00223DB811|nr:helix-turn-helix transcriptional regulator [Aquabacterium sp. A7-Y]MCW7536676.1 helix-turn-helix transcriptional regulator [Aquabacterium sp. A7-Y]
MAAVPELPVTAAPPPGATALVSTRVHHRVATVAVREHLIGWVRSGGKTLLGPDGRTCVRRDELFLVAAGTQWDVINDPAPEGRYVAQLLLLSKPLVQRFHTRHAVAQATPRLRGAQGLRADAELAGAIERAAATLAAPDALAELQEHRLIEVLLLLAQRGWTFEPAEESWQDRVRCLIANRLHADWTLDTLAREFHTSPSTLSRRLAEQGTTLGGVVRELRLETALGLLQTTELPVGEIAARCGYESHSRFTAAFRRRYGFAPSQLRPGVPSPMTTSEQQMLAAG